MKKLDLKTVPKDIKPSQILDGLPDKLKTVKSFKRIEKELQDILKIDHEHKSVKSYVKCTECQLKREQRQQLMLAEGFKNIQQYMEWKKIMTIIKNKKSFQIR